jgi:hypothetical protein
MSGGPTIEEKQRSIDYLGGQGFPRLRETFERISP